MFFIQSSSLSMMTSPVFAFCLVCLFMGGMGQATNQKLSSFHHQGSSFVSPNVGGSLTLQCVYEQDDSLRIYWYKQSLGQKPQLMCELYPFKKNGTFHDEFNNNPRFTLDTETGQNHLMITDLSTSDSATYYCARRVLFRIEFGTGVIVSVKGSGLTIPALVHQSSASETIQPGGSVTLNCTVHTGTCDGEHSVYWFKNSEKSQPGLIYTHVVRDDHCEKKPNTETHTCVYNLPMKSLNRSHAGTYYCAVASCGHILFGNGTKLDFEDEPDHFILEYVLSGGLAFTTVLLVFLALSVFKMKKRNSYLESQLRCSAPSTANAEDQSDADNLHYAALSVNPPNRPRRQRKNTQTECVYSSVKQ